MFTVSTKGLYGLLAVFELATNFNKGHIQIKEIANNNNIPQHYLEQLLVILKKAGFVKSYRGNQGGYSLAKHPEQINVLNVLECLEGNLEIVPSHKLDNALSFFWEAIKYTLVEELNISINELMFRKQKQQITYSI